MDYPYQYQALTLDGKSSAQASSDIGVKFDGKSSFTLDAWVRLNNPVIETPIISQKDVFTLAVDGNSLVFWMKGYMRITTNASKSALNANEWNRVSVVYTSAEFKLYINAILNVSVAFSGQGASNNEPFEIGSHLNGEIGQIRVFNKPLSTDEVRATMLMEYNDLQATSHASSLKAYYDFGMASPKERVKNTSVTLVKNAAVQAYYSMAKLEGNAYLSIENEPAINPGGRGNDAYSVQAWVYLTPEENHNCYTIFANGDVMGEAGISIYIERESDGFYLKSLRGETKEDNILKSVTKIPEKQWVNIAVTYDGLETHKLYVDGSLDKTKTGNLPIPSQLAVPHLHIGSDVIQGSENGVFWFNGGLSRLDIWNGALTQAEVRTYALSEPDMQAEGLQAAYNFTTFECSNLINLNPLQLCNNAVLTEVCKPVANDIPPAGDTVCLPEPLSPETLRNARRAALCPDIAVLKKYENDVMKLISDDPGIEQLLAEEDTHEIKERLQKSLAAFANPDNPDDVPCFTVTTHTEHDKVYFIGHYPDESKTILVMDSFELDDYTIWLIELILIILGGVLLIIGGLKINGATDAVSRFIRQNIANNTIITAVLSGDVTVAMLIQFFNAVYKAGVLTKFVKLVFSGMSIWKLGWFIIRVVGLAVLAAVGPAWAYYLAALADLTISVVLHVSKKPRPVPSISPFAITFNHNLSAAGAVGSIAIRKNRYFDNKAPEWTTPTVKSYAAYTMDSTAGKRVMLRVKFSTGSVNTRNYQVRATDTTNVLGTSNEIQVSTKNGFSDPEFVNIEFPNHKLNNGGIKKYDISLKWEYYDTGSSQWVVSLTSTHCLYVILKKPAAPWTTDRAMESAAKSLLWADALDYACTWAAGLTTEKEAAKVVTETVNQKLSLQYDTKKGASFYTELEPSYRMYYNCFSLTKFLQQLNKTMVHSDILNCTDCATIVATFAGALGCDLYEIIMSVFNPISGRFVGFTCNEIQAIGISDWKVPFTGGFSYHEVAAEKDKTQTDNRRYKVYDACLKVNGSKTPASATKSPYLPVDMEFSQFSDTRPLPITDIPVNASYREHLATNTNDGIGNCKYLGAWDDINFYYTESGKKPVR